MYLFVCPSVYFCTTYVQCLWRPVEGIGSLGAEITGGCQPLHVDAGNQTQILWKSKNCSQSLTHFFSSSHLDINF